MNSAELANKCLLKIKINRPESLPANKGEKVKKPSTAKRLAAIEKVLTPELLKRIDNFHNIEGDVLTFNDKLMLIKDDVKLGEQALQLKLDAENQIEEIKKTARRINKTHGELFKFRAEQLTRNEEYSKGLYDLNTQVSAIKQQADKVTTALGTAFNKLHLAVTKSWWMKLDFLFTYQNAFWVLASVVAWRLLSAY